MQFTDWLLVEVALLFIGLIKIFKTKSGFDNPSVIESLLGYGPWLSPLAPRPGHLVSGSLAPMSCTLQAVLKSTATEIGDVSNNLTAAHLASTVF